MKSNKQARIKPLIIIVDGHQPIIYCLLILKRFLFVVDVNRNEIYIILRISLSMLAKLFIICFLWVLFANAHIMNPTLSHKSFDNQDKYASQSANLAKSQNAPQQHNFHHFTDSDKLNYLNYRPTQASQMHNQPLPLDMAYEVHQNEVRTNSRVNINQNEVSHHNIGQSVESGHNFEDKLINSKDGGTNAFQNYEPPIEKSGIVKIEETVSEHELRSQEESQFINNEEKMLYLKFIQTIHKFINKFSSKYNSSTEKQQNKVTIHSDLASQSNLTQLPTNFSEDQTVDNIPNSSQINDSTLGPRMRSFQMQKDSNKLINDTQNLIKRKKKLYFIICTLSFGATCIFLIKLLGEKEQKKHQRREIIKVPQQEFYIQQI